MNLDPALLEILVCPDCRAPLAVDEDSSELVCTRCGLAYPVRDDIPVLLADEARRTREPAVADASADLGARASAQPGGTAADAGTSGGNAGPVAGGGPAPDHQA